MSKHGWHGFQCGFTSACDSPASWQRATARRSAVRVAACAHGAGGSIGVRRESVARGRAKGGGRGGARTGVYTTVEGDAARSAFADCPRSFTSSAATRARTDPAAAPSLPPMAATAGCDAIVAICPCAIAVSCCACARVATARGVSARYCGAAAVVGPGGHLRRGTARGDGAERLSSLRTNEGSCAGHALGELVLCRLVF